MCRGAIVSDDTALARRTIVPALVGGEEIVVDPMAPGLKGSPPMPCAARQCRRSRTRPSSCSARCSTTVTGVGHLDAILRKLGLIDRREAAAMRAHVESGRGVLELAPARIATDAVCPLAGRG